MWVIVVLGLLGWWFVASAKKGIAAFWRMLEETNQRHGTRFGTSPKDKATVVGVNLYKGGVLAFDQTNRKIAYISKGGKSIEILGYSFVQSWQITWREKASGSGAKFGIVTVGSARTTHENVVLEITTNDINRPLLRMPISSLSYAEETVARLRIMINARH